MIFLPVECTPLEKLRVSVWKTSWALFMGKFMKQTPSSEPHRHTDINILQTVLGV